MSLANTQTDLGWSNSAELTVVVTSGNADGSTVGFANELTRAREHSDFVVGIGVIRSESTAVSRSAVGASPVHFTVTKASITALTAESYYARAQYDHKLNARTYWYTGTGWERNTAAGIHNRYSFGGGLGTLWADNDTSTFTTEYGATYTLQGVVADTSDGHDTFGGLRLSYDYRRRLTANTELTSVLVADENLQDTRDFRTDLVNAVAVSINSHLALKVSWQLLYDTLPSLVGIPLVGGGGVLTGDTVFAELDTVDHLLTVALVAYF